MFGKVISGGHFANRSKELAHLKSNFTSGIHTILISPRRWGKSSLVRRAAGQLETENKSIRFCFLDLMNVRSESEFYRHFASAVLKAGSTKMEEWVDDARSFLGKFIPRLSFSPDDINNFSLSMDWEEVARNPDDILNLPETLAKEKKVRFVLCIDEFQNLAVFDNPVAFQSKLRSHWQLHQNVTFCLYGSKRHMLMDVFTKPAMPFYNFGDILFLEKIKTGDWIPFLTSKFKETGKILSPELAKSIAETARCHPYYVQQLAQQTWLRTHLTCSEDIVFTAWDSLQDQLSLLFQNLTDSLSPTQLNFLKALSDNQTQMTSKTVIDTYRLGTPGNVKKIKEALENREIIDLSGKTISFLDPLYEAWLKRDGLHSG